MESKLNFTPSPSKNGDYYPPKHKWKLIPTIFPELENTNAFLKDLLECKTSLKKIITVSQKYNINANWKLLVDNFILEENIF